MEKVDFKKKYKALYNPSKKTPQIVDAPNLQYAVLRGIGNPNTSREFSDAIGALYGLSYAISMSYKGDFAIPNFYNFVVPPLEGVWDVVSEEGYDINNKDDLKWEIGIMQPEFVTRDIFKQAKEIAVKAKKNELINEIELKEICDGTCCTFMHIGSYDNEKQSFDMMEKFVQDQGYDRIEKSHREIYLNDFRKVAPEKLKTILRFKVKKK